MTVPMSGRKTVTTAGTELPIVAAASSFIVAGPVVVKALPTNTGLVYVGNAGDGTVSSSTGYPLAAGEQVFFNFVSTLSEILVDAAVNGEGLAWLIL